MKNILVCIACLWVTNLVIPACGQPDAIVGKSVVVSKTLNLPTINGIALAIDATVHLKQGNTQSIEIKAQQNIINNIKTEVQGDTWKIEYEKNIRHHEPIHIYITLSTLSNISISGSGDVVGESKFTTLDDLKLAISGSGDITIDVAAKTLNAQISGSGNITIQGTTTQYGLSIAGSGNFEGFDLIADTANLQITGSGNGAVNVKETLKVAISGSGDVDYKGNPRIQSKVVGSGDVRASN